MMLMHRVHRLPVVDDKKKPIGIVTRTDIFEPLIAKRDDLLQDQAERRCDDDDERDDRLSRSIFERHHATLAFVPTTESPLVSKHPSAGEDPITPSMRLPPTPARPGSSAHRDWRLAAKPATRPRAFDRGAPLSRPPTPTSDTVVSDTVVSDTERLTTSSPRPNPNSNPNPNLPPAASRDAPRRAAAASESLTRRHDPRSGVGAGESWEEDEDDARRAREMRDDDDDELW